jgi:dienelactone hydrolase
VLAVVKRFLIQILVATSCSGQPHAQTLDQHREFEAARYRPGAAQQRGALERTEMAATTGTTVEGYLTKPDGDGPFPAVMYLHGCGGLDATTRQRFSRLLTGWGYVSLAIDSFATRNIIEACDRTMPDRQADALGAMVYLSNLPFVDPARIAIVGSSQGGIVALRLASTDDIKFFDIPDGLRPKAVVAFYPLCSAASEHLAIPTLILIGELDDWTPAKDCEQWMARRKGRGAAVTLVVYPGVSHAFDFPELTQGLSGFGHWMKYDAKAAQSSAEEMRKFLALQLSK